MNEIVRLALQEDLGSGDITTQSVVAPSTHGRARMVMKSAGILAGMTVVKNVFRQLDPDVSVSPHAEDGAKVSRGDVVCTIEGSARSILSGERVALNFVQRMSGIATLTAAFVSRVAGIGARIVDTRKTTPGLRALEKYAVKVGGGHNHRMGLYDAVMVKDNHIIAAGGIAAAVTRARAAMSHTMTLTVECVTLAQVKEALDVGADILLLDNMDNQTRAEAVKIAKGRALTEASGGVTLETVEAVARTGVDIISVGGLTHSAVALDMSLDFLDISGAEV